MLDRLILPLLIFGFPLLIIIFFIVCIIRFAVMCRANRKEPGKYPEKNIKTAKKMFIAASVMFGLLIIAVIILWITISIGIANM